MKVLITRVGAGRVVAVAVVLAIALATILATPLLVSADEADDADTAGDEATTVSDQFPSPFRMLAGGRWHAEGEWRFEGRMDRECDGPRHLVGMRIGVQTTAGLTGTDPSDVAAALRDGASLASYAADYGVTKDELVAGIVDAVTERVNQAVENGAITQERADEILAGLDTRAADLVDQTRPFRVRDQ